MTIKQDKNAGDLTLFIEGRIDTKTAPQLEQVIKTELEGIVNLVFDLTETSYISSAGLRVMLMAQKQMNKQGRMKVVNANNDLMEIFEVTGFSNILTIE
ncbi:MAG: STAS domain-containing protein [Oscillospiraceae bacterium]|nr:STAS domain-containing protein [Oscillospiraceae bacterium]